MAVMVVLNQERHMLHHGIVWEVVVHLVFFLHLSRKSTPSEYLYFMAFAAVLIFLMVGGSLWIMFDLHHRMY